MTIIELADVELSEGVAYLVGLLFPLLIDKQEIIDTFHKRKYIAGCVNHNDVSNEDLAYHFKEVFNLFKFFLLSPAGLYFETLGSLN